MEMSTKVMHSEEKEELQKQFGCMNGFFQLFDRRYLLGQRRHGHNQKKLTQGQSDDGKNKLNDAPEKNKEKPANKPTKEKHRASVESSRNSFSSSCSSTTFSSLDCSKRVQSVSSEPSSPTLQKQPDVNVHAPDIWDVVKDSMSRKPRAVTVKPVTKHERRGPAMTRIDSPRLLQNPKPVSYNRKDQNLAELREISLRVKDVKVASRFSCDGRESPYKVKSFGNIKELPRLSLDSKQSSIKNRANESVQTHEPGSNKRPPSGLFARLMGLEVLDDESISLSKHDHSSVSPRVRNGLGRAQMGNVITTRIPLEPAPWKQIKNKKAPETDDQSGHSVYGEIEKRLTELEFKASGKDLRALKQILEAMQRTRMRLENKRDLGNIVQPVSQTVKKFTSTIKPASVTSDNTMITGIRKVKKVSHEDGQKYPAGKRSARSLTLKASGRALSPNRVRKQSNGPSSDSNRVRKQLNGQPIGSDSKSKTLKIKPVNPLQNGTDLRNLSQDSDTVSGPSETNTSVALETEQEVMSTGETNNHEKKFEERLNEYKPMAELATLTMEQPSPVSVLDAFYAEDTPSPVKKKSYTFNDGEDFQFDELEWNQVSIDNFTSSAELNQSNSKFNHIKMENMKHPVHQIELLNSGSDKSTIKYITEILLASGLLKNLDCATTIVHLHPTGSLINPELFHVLEKTKTNASSKPNEKMRRKMVFDTVNDILVQILSMSASSGTQKGRILNGEKLLTELCSEINNLEPNTGTGLYDEIINIISADVNKRSEDWDEYCNEVPIMVLDIERLIFKDLISEVVNAELARLEDGLGRHCRQLFPV